MLQNLISLCGLWHVECPRHIRSTLGLATNMNEKPPPVVKSLPVTPSERYLEALCEQSFLSLWSYPCIFRDQHHGKEICDLLVHCHDEIFC
jgi:hypothetical protein